MIAPSVIEEEEESKADVVFLDNLSDLEDSPTTVTGDSSEPPSRPASVRVHIDRSLLRLATAEEDDDSEDGKADLYLGSCCDLRRACIIGNTIYILLTILAFVLSLVRYLKIGSIDFSEFDDDQVSSFDRRHVHYATVYTKNVCGILFAAIGIFGAATFHKSLVFCAAIWFCIDVIVSALVQRWTGMVGAGFLIHVHFALYLSFRSGKTTRENYTAACCGVETRT